MRKKREEVLSMFFTTTPSSAYVLYIYIHKIRKEQETCGGYEATTFD